jgi:hypothetical protein
MAEKSKPDTPFVAATHAYEHTVHVADQPRHRLDLTEAPRWPTPRPPAAPTAGVAGAEPDSVVRHRVDSPARLGFGFGFGFAAGMWTFRAAMGLVAAGILLLAVWRLLSAALH